MKKIKIEKYWKIKKKLSFHFYFVLFFSIVLIIAVSSASFITEELIKLLDDFIEIPPIIITIFLSLIIGLLLSQIVGKVLLIPIQNLKKSMSEVASGNLEVRLNETSIIDEVEDMYHYFNLMMNELKATEIIQSDFINNVSHEIKTPLNAVDGYATLLSDNDITLEEKNKYVSKILYNTNRMNELISNILLLSKVDNQSIEAKKKLFSLDEQIRQSILFLESKWNKKNINFNVDLETIKYYGNESLMIHVWNNLIGNAIKYSPENGEINISLKKNKINKIEFIIEDNGPGIKEEDEKHIFNKFYQADSSHKDEGNGLGLALVKKILDLSYGKIEVKNLLPHGCQFKVIL